MSYQNLLCAVDLAVDLAEDTPRIAARASDLAARFGATLTLLHVVEYIPVDPAGEALLPPPLEVQRDQVEVAQQRLNALGDSCGVAADRRLVVVGNIRAEIVATAATRGCDLVVLGARGRHGLGALLASTGKSVLVHAPCDVLAVRL